jgi:hypothetical protein
MVYKGDGFGFIHILIEDFKLYSLQAKCLNSTVNNIYYSTYLLLTSVDFILVECLISVKLERGDVKNLYSPFILSNAFILRILYFYRTQILLYDNEGYFYG